MSKSRLMHNITYRRHLHRYPEPHRSSCSTPIQPNTPLSSTKTKLMTKSGVAKPLPIPKAIAVTNVVTTPTSERSAQLIFEEDRWISMRLRGSECCRECFTCATQSIGHFTKFQGCHVTLISTWRNPGNRGDIIAYLDPNHSGCLNVETWTFSHRCHLIERPEWFRPLSCCHLSNFQIINSQPGLPLMPRYAGVIRLLFL